MLVLSRKVGQAIVISNDIKIVINRVAGNRVSIGIEAPEQVPIVRGEIQQVREGFHQESESFGGDEQLPLPAVGLLTEFDAVDQPPHAPR